MEIYRDGVEIDILPETAKCCADDAERNPLNINMCPLENSTVLVIVTIIQKIRI